MRFSNLPIADLVINIQMSKRSAENVNPLVLQREWRTDCWQSFIHIVIFVRWNRNSRFTSNDSRFSNDNTHNSQQHTVNSTPETRNWNLILDKKTPHTDPVPLHRETHGGDISIDPGGVFFIYQYKVDWRFWFRGTGDVSNTSLFILPLRSKPGRSIARNDISGPKTSTIP